MSFQETLDVEQTMIKIMLDICKKKDTNAEWQFIETHKEKSKFARTDGILVKNSYMIASVENRGRYDVTWEYVKSKKTWLLTEAKLLANIELSKTLQIPFIFCGFFANENIYVTLQVTDNKGNVIIEYEVFNTWAKKHKILKRKYKKETPIFRLINLKFIKFSTFNT